MKPTMKSINLSILAVLAFALSVPVAHAGSVQHFSLRDKNVSAEFLAVDTNACSQGIQTRVSIQAAFDVQRDNGTTSFPLISVTINIWDNCHNARLLFAQGTSDQFDLKIDPSLKKATLKATAVPLTNFTTGTTDYCDVDLV